VLIKKELAQIQVLKFPKVTAKELGRCRYAATAALHIREKGGTVLVADVFDANSRELKLRFFCDGTSHLICESWPATKWTKRKPESLLGHGSAATTKKDDEIVKAFLKNGYMSLLSCLNAFVSDVYSEKQRAAMQRKYEKREEHFALYPDYPKDLADYCDRHVFDYVCALVEKVSKGKRKVVCGHCSRRFTLKSPEGAPGKFGNCPKCGLRVKYRGMWLTQSKQEKACICIAHQAEGQLILRWTEVVRYYDGTKRRYSFYDYYRNLYMTETRKGVPTQVIYCYKYFSMPYYGYDWFRGKNGTVHYDKTHLYTDNLGEVFGESYYRVNLQAGLENCGKISLPRLLDNLKNIPATEYVFKMGMTMLAANLYIEDTRRGRKFSEVLGVSSQYMPLYKHFNIDAYEHRAIQASKTWVSFANFEKFRALQPGNATTDDIIDLLETMSFERFVNYFTKQKEQTKLKLQECMMFYKDYISMASGLKIDVSRKSIRFPQNCKEAHDAILPMFNEVKHEIENEQFQQAVEKLYAGMSEFEKAVYRIVFPKLRSDLVTEGQSLKHCVGSESYYKNHIEGSRMIFFVRAVAEPEKPFFTMEVDMRELKIRQIYGYAHRNPPTAVRKFANEFLRRLKPAA
jgi:hypothetical protein